MLMRARRPKLLGPVSEVVLICSPDCAPRRAACLPSISFSYLGESRYGLGLRTVHAPPVLEYLLTIGAGFSLSVFEKIVPPRCSITTASIGSRSRSTLTLSPRSSSSHMSDASSFSSCGSGT